MHLGAVDKNTAKKEDHLGRSLVARTGDVEGIQHLRLQRTQDVEGGRWTV